LTHSWFLAAHPAIALYDEGKKGAVMTVAGMKMKLADKEIVFSDTFVVPNDETLEFSFSPTCFASVESGRMPRSG
jgi:hypothetical protein